MREHPKRFAGFAALALQEPEKAAAEFERCVRQLGFKGALVHGTTRGVFLDDPQFTPLFETAQALDVPIYLHPAPPPKPVQEAYFGGLPGELGFFLATAAWGWHAEAGMHSLRLIVSGLFDRFPKLKLIIGHMGEDLPFSIARAEAVLSGVTKHLQRRVGEYFHAALPYHHQRILHRAAFPVRDGSGRGRSDPVLGGLSVQPEYSRTHLFKLVADQPGRDGQDQRRQRRAIAQALS